MHGVLKCCLFPCTWFHLLQAHLLSRIPLLGEKRQEVEEGPASPRVQGHTEITIISDGGVWGTLKLVCVLSSEPWPRPHLIYSAQEEAQVGGQTALRGFYGATEAGDLALPPAPSPAYR